MLNDNLTQYSDLENSSGEKRRDFLKYSTSALAWVYLGGCGSSSDSAEVTGYSIDDTVVTTRQRTVTLSQNFSSIINPRDMKNILDYDASGYGVWSYGDGLLAVQRNDIMSAAYSSPSDNKIAKLLRFFAITDIHITDKESPAQLIYMQQAGLQDFEPGVTSTYSPTMLYTTHVLDAAIQTVNALHKQNPIDFGISLGDTCNSTQYNELRWYIDILDGKVITPSSGANVGAKTIDYQKPFKAAGLDSEIPWYQAVGNHDHFWLGSIPPDAGNMRISCVSDEVIKMTDTLLHASDMYAIDTQYYMGVIDGSTPTGTIIKAGKVGDPGFTSPPMVIPDVKRRSLTKAQWAQEFFNTKSTPVGHGLNLVPEGKNPDFACYSFLPKSDLPIKVIVLDDTQSEYDGDSSIHGRGFLDEARWKWLQAELAVGTAANQLMIIAAHVPIGVAPHAEDIGGTDTYMDWYENKRIPSADMENAVTLPELLAELHNHPNLLMWMAGHRHVNTVKAFKTDDATKPERGFWHVETSSLHDFPQQLRLFEISLNSDYTISIEVTNVDPAVKEGTPAWTARKYAVAAQQIVKTELSPNMPFADPTINVGDYGAKPNYDTSIHAIDEIIGSYNAELFKQLSPAMITEMKKLFPNA